MNIFKLFGSIFVDNEKANKSISQTDKKAESLGQKFVKGAGKVAKFGAAIGGMAVAGGAAVIGLAKKTGDMADTLLDLQSTTGMSTDELQKWRRVATVAGVDTDAMAKASQKLTKTLDTMSTGTGKAAEAAEALGFSYEDLMAMNADERMNAITQALGEVDDTTERAKLGTDLLGSSWSDIAPILDVGADKIKDIKDNADIISEEDLNQANEFRIKMDQMAERATLFGQKLIMKLMPVLNKMFDWIEAHMPEIEAFFSKAFEMIGVAVDIAVDIFRTHLLPILEDAWVWFQEKLVPAIKILWQLIQDAMPTIKIIVENTFKIIKMVVMAAWDIFSKFLLPVLKTIFKWISDHMPQIQAVFKVVFAVIETAVQVVIDILEVYFGVLGKVFNFVRDVFSGIGNLIMKAFDGVTGFIDGIVEKFNKVKEAIGGAIDRVKEFFSASEEGAADPATFDAYGTTDTNVTQVSGLAKGGTTLTGGVIKVGERGPELLSVPRGATVAPLDAGMGGTQKIQLDLTGVTFIGEQGIEDLMDLMVDYLTGKGVALV